ncbi:Down syndrome cell adhesion molecule [Harpegnathos saltator]|uniref:Down syndrome cell adhesion molecule n=1 Tax=Harpegnathos saltator TaxID=610380 RepID=E2BHX4_HARSA|nr:Down syndrome cell adhesion molecule [Harpegnathos saltator]
MGPVFVKEPPNRVDFSNGTGAVVECQARGNPQPDIIWVRADGTAVGDVPGLRQVLPNGNLVFPPFRAENYRQEVHAQVYSCLARSPAGSVYSRDVNLWIIVARLFVRFVSAIFIWNLSSEELSPMKLESDKRHRCQSGNIKKLDD